MRRLNVLLLALAVLLPAALPMTAQEDPAGGDPFLEMLALVPRDVARIESIPLSYANHAALEAARPGVPQVESLDELEALGDARRLWLANFQRLYAGPANLFQYAFVDPDMRERIGFDFFTVDRSLMWGQPPAAGVILGGDFNAEAIQAAYQALGFEVATIGGLPAVCSPDGCDAGLEINAEERDPANPFGGSLGRREPLAFLPGYLINSPDLAAVEAMAATATGEQESLLDNSNFRAAAEAITAPEGDLLQAVFVSPVEMTYTPDMLAQGADRPDPMADYGTLPPYEVAVIADRQEGDDQVVMLAAVYATETAAQAALGEIAQRVKSFVPPSSQIPGPVINRFGGAVDQPYIVTTEGGPVVAVVAVRYPLPPNTPAEGESSITPSGLGMRQFVLALYNRELLPLVINAGS